jgi:catechol 2,3-dioxygenase-like lactoylglutathione lyase family enzyme
VAAMVKFVDSATTIEVKDVVASERFYREKLGFNAGVFYGEPPTFCIVRRDRVTIFLDQVRTPHQIPLNQYWALYMYVDDVDAVLADVKSRGVAIDRDIEDQFYGCRDFDLRDPDGHLIGIGQNLTKKPE